MLYFADLTTDLMAISWKRLEEYMVDCHGFDRETLADWPVKADLVHDIVANGWAQECIDYLSH